MNNFRSQTGFTLIEIIIVIVITGIIGSMVSVFLAKPVQQYMDVSRRAMLTDIADTALQRLTRDIRSAVPNSVRVANAAGLNTYLEYLPTRDGGRYRAVQNCTASCTGNTLTFGVADGVFDIIGQSINFVAGDYIVVGSTQSDGNLPYDTSASGVLRAYTGAAGAQTTVNMTNTSLPTSAELSSQRFDVVDGAQQAVSYACITLGTNSSGDGTGKLMRYWKYGFYTAQQVPPITAQAVVPGNLTAVQSAMLADKLSACSIEYNISNQRYGLVSFSLTLTSNNESVSIYHEIHVNNSP